MTTNAAVAIFGAATVLDADADLGGIAGALRGMQRTAALVAERARLGALYVSASEAFEANRCEATEAIAVEALRASWAFEDAHECELRGIR